MPISNAEINNHTFLRALAEDHVYSDHFVSKGTMIFLNLCEEIESKNPQTPSDLYELTQKATEDFNSLSEQDPDTDIDTYGAEALFSDFIYVAKAYGFEVEGEDIVGTRDW